MSTHYIRAPGLQDHVLVMPSAAVRDGRLSYLARGVLARLLTNSDGYSSTAESLKSEGTGKRKEGRDKIRHALAELKAAGYLARHGRRSSGGRWAGTDVYVFDRPQLGEPERNGKPENPPAGTPTAGAPTLKSSKSINGVVRPKLPAVQPPHTGGGGAAGENP